MCSVPNDDGYIPVIIVDLAGAHTGAVAKACVYRTAFVANLSIFGVCAKVSPYAPIRGLLSSLTIQRMLGDAGTGCAAILKNAEHTTSATMQGSITFMTRNFANTLSLIAADYITVYRVSLAARGNLATGARIQKQELLNACIKNSSSYGYGKRPPRGVRSLRG